MGLVSAIPENLTSYGLAAIEMDSRLNTQGKRLQTAIDALNNSAPDPKVLGPLPALGSQLAAYAAGNAGLDAWVGDVGNAFANADRGAALTGGVVQAQQSVIETLVKGEEPQGAAARGAQLLKVQQAGKNGFLDLLPSGRGTLVWTLQNAWWLESSWGLGAKGGGIPTVLALVKGYRLVPSADGRYIIAKGTRYLGQDVSRWEKYIESGRLDGTRYSASSAEVSKFTSFKGALKADLNSSLNPLSHDFWSASKVAGGALAGAVTIGSDIWDYGFGDDKKAGFGSKFAGALTVDTATTAGTIAVADGATALGGAAAGAMIGAEAGLAVPIVGNVVGLAVGAGVGYLLSTSTGRALRNVAVQGVSDAYHAVSNVVTHPGNDLKTVGHVLSDLNPF